MISLLSEKKRKLSDSFLGQRVVETRNILERLKDIELLDILLSDKTTDKFILWGTDTYSELGKGFQKDEEIRPELLLNGEARVLPRAQKDKKDKEKRTKSRAEVFTPTWVVKKMNDFLDAEWFGYENVFEAEKIDFKNKLSWQDYINSTRLEITCGEAPFIVSRYDAATGEDIPIEHRVGLLDRKIRVVNENAADDKEWLEWLFKAFQSVYGYEFQGDSLLIARINLLLTFEEQIQRRLEREPFRDEYQLIAHIITWNFWQMDGLSGTIPYCRTEEEFEQLSLFGRMMEAERNDQPPCRIFDWRAKRSMEYRKLTEEKRA